MIRLAAFFFLAFANVGAIFFAFALVGGELSTVADLLTTLVAVLVFAAILTVPATTVAVVIRHLKGRLSGFTAGLIAAGWSLATITALFGRFLWSQVTGA